MSPRPRRNYNHNHNKLRPDDASDPFVTPSLGSVSVMNDDDDDDKVEERETTEFVAVIEVLGSASTTAAAAAAATNPHHHHNQHHYDQHGEEQQVIPTTTMIGTIISSSMSLVVKILCNRRRRRIRRALQSYLQYMSVTGNLDKGLKLLQYTLWLASKLLYGSSCGYNRNRKNTFRPGEHQQQQQQQASPPNTVDISSFLSTLSSQLSLTRCLLRLLIDFPMALQAFLLIRQTNGMEQQGQPQWNDLQPQQRVQCGLAQLLTWTTCLYYPADHMVFFHSLWQPQQQEQHNPNDDSCVAAAQGWSLWSSRGWLVNTVLELLQGVLQYKALLQSQQQQQQQQQKDNLPNESCHQTTGKEQENWSMHNHRHHHQKRQQHGQEEQQQQLKLQLTRNALFLLPALYFSFPPTQNKAADKDTSWLWSLDFVNFLLWLESVVCLYQSTTTLE